MHKVATVSCNSCGAIIDEVMDRGNGQLQLCPDLRKRTTFCSLELRRPGHVYRFFCSVCGKPTDWDSGQVPISDYRERITLDSVTTVDTTATEHQFARIVVTPQSAQPDSMSDAIETCAKAFASNVSRVNEIADCTLLTVGLTYTTQELILHMLRQLDDEERHFGRPLGDDLNSRAMIEFSNAMQFLHKIRGSLPPDIASDMTRRGELSLERWSLRHPSLALGIRAVLLAQVSMAWTAFEVLSSDLWVAAVNERPNPFAVRYATSVQPKGQDKSISLTALAKYAQKDFDLSKVMGDLFVKEKKVDFASLGSTRFAYEKAFNRSMPAIDTPDLKLLELVRNLVLHQAGVVDQHFKDRLVEAGIEAHPDCVHANTNEPFPIDAAVVSRLAMAGSKAGEELLSIVTKELLASH